MQRHVLLRAELHFLHVQNNIQLYTTLHVTKSDTMLGTSPTNMSFGHDLIGACLASWYALKSGFILSNYREDTMNFNEIYMRMVKF
jgi:hypothetical protein